ncbi:Uncharacterised protein [Pseudomonas aeruginosa]|nr:Uncharacterised protein [Pseudomonas aeruginosa]
MSRRRPSQRGGSADQRKQREVHQRLPVPALQRIVGNRQQAPALAQQGQENRQPYRPGQRGAAKARLDQVLEPQQQVGAEQAEEQAQPVGVDPERGAVAECLQQAEHHQHHAAGYRGQAEPGEDAQLRGRPAPAESIRYALLDQFDTRRGVGVCIHGEAPRQMPGSYQLRQRPAAATVWPTMSAAVPGQPLAGCLGCAKQKKMIGTPRLAQPAPWLRPPPCPVVPHTPWKYPA